MTQDVVSQIMQIRGRSVQAEAELLRDFIAATVRHEVDEAVKAMRLCGTVETEKLLTVREAANYLSVTERTLYVWVDKNKIPHRRLNDALRFSRQELERWSKGEPLEASQTEAARTSLRAIR